MAILRKIIAATVAAAAIGVSVGITQAEAAPVKFPTSVVVTPLGGQGEWPI